MACLTLSLFLGEFMHWLEKVFNQPKEKEIKMSVVTSKKVSKASKNTSKSKNGKVTSSLDKENKALTDKFIASINFDSETEAFWASVELMNQKKISHRGVKASLLEAEKIGALPSLRPSMAQYFQQAAKLMQLNGGADLTPKQAILAVQNGKRSKAYKSSKEFDKALAVAKSAVAIVKNSKAGKRETKSTKPTIQHSDNKNKVSTAQTSFSDALEIFLTIAQNRTDHTIKDMAKAEALLGVLKQAVLSQKAKNINHPVVAERKSA